MHFAQSCFAALTPLTYSNCCAASIDVIGLNSTGNGNVNGIRWDWVENDSLRVQDE